MSAKEVVQELAHNPKIAAGVSAVTTGTGAGTVLEWIPDDIGKLATLIGIALSIILIRVHLVALKKAQFELEVMKAKEDERQEAATRRKAEGQPLRRNYDPD